MRVRPFEDEVNEIMVHYHDVARAHGMDRALREAVESNVFTRRECAGLRRRVEELQRQLAGEVVEALEFLWQEYVQADPATLTEDAKELAERVRQKVRELAGVQQLETRLAEVEAQAAIMRSALEDVDAVHRSALGQANERGDNLTPLQVWERVRAALASDAGRETAERLRLLEELADVAAAFVEGCDFNECAPRGAALTRCDVGACRMNRLQATVQKLKGGRDNAGTGS